MGGSKAKGVFIGGLLTAGAVAFLTWLGSSQPSSSAMNSLLIGAVFFIGATQVLWMVPAVLYFWIRGQGATVKGLVILAGIIFMLNAGCWGMLLSGESRYSSGFKIF